MLIWKWFKLQNWTLVRSLIMSNSCCWGNIVPTKYVLAHWFEYLWGANKRSQCAVVTWRLLNWNFFGSHCQQHYCGFVKFTSDCDTFFIIAWSFTQWSYFNGFFCKTDWSLPTAFSSLHCSVCVDGRQCLNTCHSKLTRLVTVGPLQSSKWQPTGVSQWYRCAVCGLHCLW